ncbi:MAG: PAS domain-containing protein, partial [Okeania sp. SIO2D1]|nr:PAS domain-containing protein [Okeania sp. SIO2D1]
HAIYVKDWQGRFILANQAFADFLGTTPEGVIGKTERDFVPNPEEAEEFVRHDRQVIESLKTHHFDNIFTTPTGEVVYLQTTKTPIFTDNGRNTYVLGVSSDVTPIKQAEITMREAAEAAESANRAKSEFLASIIYLPSTHLY